MRWSIKARRYFLGLPTVALLLAQPFEARAQEPTKSGSSPQSTEKKTDVSALVAAIQQMQAELRDLHAEVKDLRTQQRSAESESAELRKELASAKAQLALLAPSAAPPASTAAVETNPESPTIADRVTNLEENQQLADAKSAEQNQSKVESGSKYRLRLSGIVLFNVFGNQGTVDNIDFPQLATPAAPLYSEHSFGASVRQSQIGLQSFGPTIAGARTSADIQFDFAGGIPKVPNGVSFGIMRLRTGTIRFDWTKTSVIGGQDTLFFAPLTPTSIATIAIPALAYSGNLWSWTPQVRVEHTFAVSESSSLKIQGGILDPLSGDIPAGEYNRYPTWGEDSGQPAYAGRVAWTQKLRTQDFTVGAGGYYSRQMWGFERAVDSWVSTVDLKLPLESKFEFTGQFYRGRALGGLGGGFGQSVLWNGSLADPATTVHGLDSLGGWAQLKFRASPKLQFNAAVGQDNPFASELREFGSNLTYYGAIYSRNQSGLVNFIYEPRSDVLFSFEYRRLKTSVLDGQTNTANVLNLSVGYVF